MLLRDNKGISSISGSNEHIYQFVATDIHGAVACYFVQMNKRNKILFDGTVKKAPSNAPIDFEHYGSIIASCYGAEPTGEVMLLLKEHYNYAINC